MTDLSRMTTAAEDSRSRRAGCKKCGMVGCDCDAVTRAAPSACKKCRGSPCECEGRQLRRLVGERQVCVVCRRQQPDCICRSHVSAPQSRGDPHLAAATAAESRQLFTAGQVNSMVIEALNFYYNRDAEGLQRWLRQLLSK